MEEETRRKLSLQSRIRQLESDNQTLKEQHDEAEEAKGNLEKHVQQLLVQLADLKKKADEIPVEQLEELKRKAAKDIEALQKQLVESEQARDRAERSKKKIQQEVKYSASMQGR